MSITLSQLVSMVMNTAYRYDVSHGKSPRVLFASPDWVRLFRKEVVGSLAQINPKAGEKAYVAGMEIRLDENLPGVSVSTHDFK